MSEEFDHSNGPTFTSFIPLTILLAAFIIWFGFQDYVLNAQRRGLNNEFQSAVPSVSEAQTVSKRYVDLMRDLVQTAQKDDDAKAIVNAAIKAGLIQQKPNTNSPDASATPPSK